MGGWSIAKAIVREEQECEPWSWINTGHDSLLSSRPCPAALPVLVLWGISPLTLAKI